MQTFVRNYSESKEEWGSETRFSPQHAANRTQCQDSPVHLSIRAMETEEGRPGRERQSFLPSLMEIGPGTQGGVHHSPRF